MFNDIDFWINDILLSMNMKLNLLHNWIGSEVTLLILLSAHC